MNRKEAMMIVETTEEVKALYELNDGVFINCIEKSVVRPCDTEWVTCIDDAWVVEFKLGKACGIEHDGRLKITMVVNAKTGEIISRFPEAEYFKDKNYCLESYDCISIPNNKEGLDSKCVNFVYGQIEANGNLISEACRCSENICQKDLN
ncbi:MAG: hypothetical protein KDK36_06715 [Leptospiraceae bacterium]|nr:hypothetical protein [Leptospiraceae bacterium]